MLKSESKSKCTQMRGDSLLIDISTFEVQVKKLCLNAKRFKQTGKRIKQHCRTFVEKVRPFKKAFERQVYEAFLQFCSEGDQAYLKRHLEGTISECFDLERLFSMLQPLLDHADSKAEELYAQARDISKQIQAAEDANRNLHAISSASPDLERSP